MVYDDTIMAWLFLDFAAEDILSVLQAAFT